MAPDVDEILDHLAQDRRDVVVDALVELAEREGVEPVVRLVSAVQQEVGHRWQTARWSVADEHAATSILDRALAVATAAAPRRSPIGRIVLACAEQEWHILPARMFAALLEERGWEVTFLGGSLPADHLATYLLRHRPDIVAISCSLPIYLPGARRSISAAHRVGLPVLAGGSAFGAGLARAVAVGADARAADAADADRIARSRLIETPRLRLPSDDSEQLALAAMRADLVATAMTALVQDAPATASPSVVELERTREDLDHVVQSIEASILTGDEQVVAEFVRWLVDCLRARGTEVQVLAVGLHALRAALDGTTSDAHRLLDTALASVAHLP